MATDLDELQIVITSNSNEAAEAIDKLVKGLENLNSALGSLDASKVNSFASAMTKLANVGNNTNTTNKALKSMASDIAEAYGVKTKKGITEITQALGDMYKAFIISQKNDTPANFDKYMDSVDALRELIKAHYTYQTELDESTRKVQEFVKAQKASGTKIGFKNVIGDFTPEDFKKLNKELGGILDPKKTGAAEGVRELDEFLRELQEYSGAQINTHDIAQGIKDVQDQIKIARESILDFGTAFGQGEENARGLEHYIDGIVKRLVELYDLQSQFGATSGLSGLVDVFTTISNINIPDMSGLAQLAANINSKNISAVAKAMGEVAVNANSAVKEVSDLSTILGNGFTMRNPEPFKGVEFPPAVISQIQSVVPQIEVIPEVFNEKLLPAVINTENEFTTLYQKMANVSPVESAYDALTAKFNEFQAQTSQQQALPMFEKMLPAVVQTQSVTDKLFSSLEDVVREGPKLDAVTKAYVEWHNQTTKMLPALNETFQYSGLDNYTKVLKKYKEELLGLNKVETQKVEVPKVETPDTSEIKKEAVGLAEISERLNQISEGFEGLAQGFGNLADKGTELFKKLLTPLKVASEEYVEKFKSMSESVARFQKNFKAHMKKVSDFWKRTMRTFTFMIVRKAFTAILKEIGTATQSLALYSNAMGTAFNTDLSHMVADFQYLGRSIVSVFAPLLNYIVPIIDAIVDRIATLLSYIGMLFTALGGGTSFTKAKKDVSNYAESLDQANKSANNLTMGIDELNILNEKSSGSAKPYDGWEDAWEQVEIPQGVQDMSDKIKKLFEDIFSPMKRAWDLAKQYVLDGWKSMTDSMKALGADIWDDFLRVWKGDTVAHIFYNLLMILGDIERVISNLADNFREAWNEGDKGYQILSNIAKIADILVQHVRNVTDYMVEWSSNIDFTPFIDSLENLTKSLTDLAEFVGQVFEDVMERVVLKYINFLIEEGLPHLNNTIAETLTYFDFKAIREKLQPLEDAFEHLLENLDIGKTEALGNLGKAFAEFTDSESFDNFLATIEHMMNAIDAEDVEKILTGIGLGIGKIAESIANFVGSELFNSFIDDLDEWMANASEEDIAGILELVAKAIAMFKFAEFASEGLSGFFKFAGLLKTFKDFGDISKNFQTLSHDLGLIGSELGVVGMQGGVAAAGEGAAASGLTALAAPAAVVVAVIAAVVMIVYSLTESFGGLSGLLMRIKEEFEKVADRAKFLSDKLGFTQMVDNLKDAFHHLGEKLGNLRSFWELVIDAIGWFATAVSAVLIPILTVIVAAVNLVIDAFSALVDVVGGVADVIYGFFTFDPSKIMTGVDRVVGAVDDFAEQVVKHVTGNNEKVVEETSKGAKRAAGTYAQDYASEMKNLESVYSNANSEALYNAAETTEYKKASEQFAANSVSAMTGTIENQDFSSFSSLFSGKVSDSLLQGKEPFETTNAEIATGGAETFSTEYLNGFENGTSINEAMTGFGQEGVQAFTAGMEAELSTQSVGKVVQSIFKQINETAKSSIETLKGNLATNIGVMISTLNFTSSFTTLFGKITEVVNTHINNLGMQLQSSTLATFMETYIAPFFGVDTWQPLFDSLLNDVFVGFFDTFSTWFNDEAVSPFWEESVLPWFDDGKWNDEVFTPLSENVHNHWDTFMQWWDESMRNWWEEHVIIWFEEKKWEDQFNIVLKTAKAVFELIRLTISSNMEEASKTVDEACQSMKNSIASVIEAIGDMMRSLEGFNKFEGSVTFDFGTPVGYALGGFPAQGTLFYAGESGAEFVSNVNGRTGVVSNGEITGIADAVYATGGAESQLLAELVNIAQSLLDKDPVVLSDRELAMAVDRGKSRLGMSIIT